MKLLLPTDFDKFREKIQQLQEDSPTLSATFCVTLDQKYQLTFLFPIDAIV